MINSKRSAAQESARCLLCAHAPCNSACQKNLNPADFVRSIRFENFRSQIPCGECEAPCEKACLHPDRPVRIKELNNICITQCQKNDDISLEIVFCGVKCENPFFLSSSVVASGYEMCARALFMGWGGIVYKTIGIFPVEESSPRFDAVYKDGSEFFAFRNWEQTSQKPYTEDFEILKRLKQNFPSKVIVASIMGQNEAEWEQLAIMCNEANVDMIECNFSCPHMSESGLGSDIGTDEKLVSSFTAAVRRKTNLPILAKMTPNITNVEIPAVAAIKAGADAIAAINTVKSLTSALNTDTCGAVSGLSGKAVKPIALRFINDIRTALPASPISGMGGIETWYDAAEFIALGCSNVQITTAVMQFGYRIIDDLIDGLKSYLCENNITLRGLVGRTVAVSAGSIDRSTMVMPVVDRNKCVGCGRCFLSCKDGGHDAITFEERKPKLTGGNCEGCMLCMLVCPMGAISLSKRIAR